MPKLNPHFDIAERVQGLREVLQLPLLEQCQGENRDKRDVSGRVVPHPRRDDPKHDACHGHDPAAERHRTVRHHGHRLLVPDGYPDLLEPSADHRRALELQSSVRAMASDVQRLRERLPHDEALGGHLDQIRCMACAWSSGKCQHQHGKVTVEKCRRQYPYNLLQK